MTMENGYNSNDVLSERAKELLKSEEYERLDIAVKNFSKTRSVETLCSNLFKIKIVNPSAKVDILADVRRCLPKNQRNKFTRYCNELLKTESLRKRRDLEKNRKIGEAKSKECKRGRDLENFAANLQGSPAKKTRQDRVKLLKFKTEKKAFQRNAKSAPGCAIKERKETATSKTQVRNFDPLPSKSASMVIILKRDSLNQSFGFRIRGGNSREPSITVAEVAKGSLADGQGLNRGAQIVRVNDKRCGKGGRNIAELIRKIKAAKVLHMRIVPPEPACNDECKVRDVGEENGKRKKQEVHRLTTVSVFPEEDGWLGCCIRGGVDYACDVHVISVDAGSPAERAGVKAGDAIVKINGTSIKNLTHVQVVRLVVTSGPCVKFSLKTGGQRRRSLRQQTANIRPTPLRTQHTRSHDVTSLRSPSFRQFHLPGYPYQSRGVVVDSPSQLPLDVMSLDCLPPPPYTPEVPSRHRVLARGEEGQGTPPQQPQESQELHCSQETQGTIFHQELQEATFRQELHGIHWNHKPQNTTFRDESTGNPCQQEPQGIPFQQEPQGNQFQQEPQGNPFQQEPQGNPFQQEPQGPPCQVVAMEMIDEEEMSDLIADEDASFDEKYMPKVFHDEGKNEQGFGPHSSVMQQGNVLSLDEGTPLEETPDDSLPSCSSTSSTKGNSTESFLSQIQQFNKANLKRLEDCPQSNTSEELYSSPSVNCHTPEKIQSTSDGCSLSSSTNPSPQGNGRESFLSQIRQFNKAKLKKLSDCPKQSNRDQLEGHPSAISGTPEEVLQSTEGGIDAAQVNAQDSIDADSLFTALTRVMQSRARVLHDTLSSADEYDSDSSNDDCHDEWEL